MSSYHNDLQLQVLLVFSHLLLLKINKADKQLNGLHKLSRIRHCKPQSLKKYSVETATDDPVSIPEVLYTEYAATAIAASAC